MGETEDDSWKRLPIEDKIQHKVWKARMEGYEDLKKVFEKARIDEKSPEYSKYQHYMKNLPGDANAFAQEKGLECLSVFVENASVAPKTASEVVPVVVAKGLGGRPKTSSASREILLMYIEIEKQELVIEELGKAFSHKTPKNVVAACQVIREALNSFGNKVVGIKPLLKIFPPLFKHKDKVVRDEAKLLAVEMYRWVNMAVKQALAAAPPLVLKELEEEWAKLPTEPALPIRFLRSQQDYKAKVEAQAAAMSGGAEGDSGGAVVVAAVDPYEFLDPVEILSKVSPDFMTQLEDKKWSIRKDALTVFKTLASAPKLEAGDYGEIVRQLKKIISKDANIMVVVVAVECTTLLANGLRKKFASYATHIFSGLLERFKEKKATVIEALRSAADAVIRTAKFEGFLEDIFEHLESKSPSVKAETLLVLARYIQKSAKPAEFSKSVIKQFMPVLIKRLAESFPEVRESSYEVIASIWKLVGEKTVMIFLSDLDKLKMDKIKEWHDKLVNGPKKIDEPQKSAAPAAAVKAPPASAPAGTTEARSVKPGSKPGAKPAGKKKPPPKKEEVVNERELGEGDVEQIREDKFSDELRAKFDSNNWKERLEGTVEFKKVLVLMEPEQIPCQAFVKILGGKTKFKETNFSVLKAKFALIGEVARLGKFSKTSFLACSGPMIDKIGDVKAGVDVKAALIEISEKVGFPIVAEEVLNLAMEQKNPKNQSEAFGWLAETIKLFGFKGVPPKLMVEKIKVCLLASNPAVRQNAIALAGVMFLYMGPNLRMLFETEKPPVLAMIDAEFAKLKDEKPPAVTRGVKPSDGETAAGEDEPAEEAEPEDILPRSNISEKITEELLAKFADSKWKVRQEGLHDVQKLIKEAAFVTPHLGDLPPALNKMFADKNKMLASETAAVCTDLAAALGPGCKQHVKVLAPGMIGLLTDGKPAVRQNAIKCMDAWLEKTKLAVFFEDEIIVTSLRSTNVFVRQEIYAWLEKHMSASQVLPIPELMAIIPVLFTALEDRSGDIRKAAQGALLMFMAHAGYDKVFRQTSKLSPTSQAAVAKILEAQRANIPDIKGQFKTPAPVQQVASAPAAVARKPAPVVAAPAADSDNESDAGSEKAAPVKKVVKKPGAGLKKPSSARGGKPAEEEDLTPPLKICTGKESKEQRLKDEINHKVLKWNFNTAMKEHVQQLNDLMVTICSPTLHGLLFHADFKNHIQAMQILTDLCTDENREVFVHNTDLLVKWCSLRLFDTNTTVVFKVLDLLIAIFTVCNDSSFTLTDNEATAILPYIITLRIGDPKEEIRKKVHLILKALPNIYTGTKIFAMLMDGTKQKNARGRSECLEALSGLIEYLGMPVCSPSQPKAIKDVAAIIGDKDASVRNSALSLLIQAINICGVEQVQKWIGTLPEKQQSMLDERVKRNVKKPAAAPVNENPNAGIVSMTDLVGPGGRKRPTTAPGSRPGPAQATSAGDFEQSQRPQTSGIMQAPNREGNSCKNNRYFNVDFDELEKNRTPLWQPPSFYSNPEVEAMILEPLPSFTIKSQNYSNLSLLTSSSDASNTLGLALSSVTDIDTEKSKISLLQIAELLRDEDKRLVFQKPDVNKLVISLTMQLKVCVTHHLQGAFDSDKLASLIRALLDTSTALFGSNPLALQVSSEALLGLMHELINCAVDQNFARLPEPVQFQQSFNNILFDILQNSDFTVVTCICLKLLRNSVGANVSSTSQDIILKCLWKLLKLLPNHAVDLDYAKVLYECHLFLKDYPSSYWETQSKDTPSRTIKTLVHSLIKIKGEKILDFTREITDLSSSELLPYLNKVVDRLSHKGALEKGVSKTNEQIIEDLVRKYHDVSDPNNGVNACKLFINLKLKNPSIDTSKFLSVVDAPTARWIKNVLENPYYEKARNRYKNPQTVLAEVPERSMEHYSEFLTKMKSTMQTWTHELHGVQESSSTANPDEPNIETQDVSKENHNDEPVISQRPKTAPVVEPLSSRPTQNFDTGSSLDTKSVQEFKQRLAMIKSRATQK